MRTLLVAIAVLSSGCDLLDKKDPPPTVSSEPTPAAKEAPPADTWVKFESKEGGFKAEFPSAPTTEKAPVSAVGVTVEMVTYSSQLGDAYFAVATSEFPEAIVSAKPAATLLDSVRDGAANSIGGTLAEEKQIEVDGNAARRLVITANAEGIAIAAEAVIFLKGQRLYQAMVVRPANVALTAEVDRFLGSLHPLG